MNTKLPDTDAETRQQRREKRRRKKRERIPQHGRSLASIYKEAILKRLKHRETEK